MLEAFCSWGIDFRRHKKSHWLQTVGYEEINFLTAGKKRVGDEYFQVQPIFFFIEEKTRNTFIFCLFRYDMI